MPLNAGNTLSSPSLHLKKALLITGSSRLSAMKQLVSSLGGSKESEVIYIGDSGTDIECLLEDGIVGIVILNDENSSLVQTMKRINVDIAPINKRKENLWGIGKEVYHMSDFSEIIGSSVLG